MPPGGTLAAHRAGSGMPERVNMGVTMSYPPGDHQSHQPPQPPYFAPPPPPPVRKRPIALWIGLGLLAVAILGGAILGAIAESRPDRSSDASSGSPTAARQRGVTTGDTKVVTASDNSCQLTVPTTWKDVPASWRNEHAVIQLGNGRQEQYVLVVSAAKDDFDDFVAFEEAALSDVDLGMEDGEVSQPRPITVGGLPAARYEISAKLSGVRVVFWYTLVDGKNGYYQIATWTLRSKRDEAEGPLGDVVATFRELGVE
ncbi:MAG TPA: hypothetical protein VGX25_10630 [Actinophytocola sp.]|uniref:hypothetical protein n=1 Tax=Actinophytocola sp. TaxID=1872138 RepID=UPI002DDD91D6|nr:hypothetical protein [Actinophytocola sp.]HEV2779841.1 hypothetical protein [Actinophytocola sp.]